MRGWGWSPWCLGGGFPVTCHQRAPDPPKETELLDTSPPPPGSWPQTGRRPPLGDRSQLRPCVSHQRTCTRRVLTTWACGDPEGPSGDAELHRTLPRVAGTTLHHGHCPQVPLFPVFSYLPEGLLPRAGHSLPTATGRGQGRDETKESEHRLSADP